MHFTYKFKTERPLYSALHDANDDTQGYLVGIGIYAHGHLEERLGYDVLAIHKDVLKDLEDGIYKVNVLDKKDVEREALMFYWRFPQNDGPRHRAYVVSIGDGEAIRQAYKKYNQRAMCI